MLDKYSTTAVRMREIFYLTRDHRSEMEMLDRSYPPNSWIADIRVDRGLGSSLAEPFRVGNLTSDSGVGMFYRN